MKSGCSVKEPNSSDMTTQQNSGRREALVTWSYWNTQLMVSICIIISPPSIGTAYVL